MALPGALHLTIPTKDYLLHYAAQGYHVRAPDTRNVNNSQSTTSEMSLDLLADDFLGVLKSTGQSKAVIVGHDWGSGTAWSFAIKYPQHTAALVTMAVSRPPSLPSP
jgi:soluble epoxide hydrolase/lipid-phosphate phosphatase